MSHIDDVRFLGAVLSAIKLTKLFVFVVRLGPGMDRYRVIDALNQRQVPSRTYFSPIHLQPFHRERFGFTEGDFPDDHQSDGRGRRLRPPAKPRQRNGQRTGRGSRANA
jgi:hypothetical protein